jgi:phenylalanyl-tRNA synthetase beta chain
VAEEVARAFGYDRVPSRLPEPVLPAFRPDPSAARHRIRRILAGLGLDEVLTHALIGTDDLRRSGYAADGGLVRVANPLAEQHAIMRPVLYPSLLGALAENVRQRRLDPWLFEVGKTYWMGDPGRPASDAETAGTGRFEAWHVGIALLGPRGGRLPGDDARDADVAEIKGIVDALHAALGARPPSYRPEGPAELHPHLHPGRAARIVSPAGADYGSVGEVDPRVAAAWDLPGRPVIGAINVAQLLALVPVEQRVVPVPAAQPIDRDLAIVVPEATLIGDLLRVLRAAAGPQLADAHLFDIYRGPQVGDGRVSYAVSLRFQPEHAADEAVVDRALNRIRGSLTHHLGAEFR